MRAMISVVDSNNYESVTKRFSLDYRPTLDESLDYKTRPSIPIKFIKGAGFKSNYTDYLASFACSLNVTNIIWICDYK